MNSLQFQRIILTFLVLIISHTVSPTKVDSWSVFKEKFELSNEEESGSHTTDGVYGESDSVSNGTLPNIVIIFVDDLGYGDLSFTGHPTSWTPAIDGLAAQSKVWTHFYVPAPVCSPSRAALLTGRYPVRSGIYPGTFFPDASRGLSTDETTLAELLKTKGYRTLIAGKWHLGVGVDGEFLPAHHGFDDYLGVPYSTDMCSCEICYDKNKRCKGSCESQYVSCPLYSNSTIIEQPVYLPTLTGRLMDKAEQFVQENVGQDTPFFLFMSFYHMHHPQFSSKVYEGTSSRGQYGDSLAELDGSVGRLLKLLEEEGIEDDTIVWFMSDNGPDIMRQEYGGSAGLLRCGKATTWEGGVRVPSFVRWPEKIQPGRSNDLISSLEVLPTLASITKTDVSHLQLDGLDASAHLLQPGTASPREFLALYPKDPTKETSPYAVLWNKYKAHYYTQGSVMSDDANYDTICREAHPVTKHQLPLLYDLAVDPGERWNRANATENSSILATMSAWRLQHMSAMLWMPPLTSIKFKRAQPCCNDRSCDPFPACCDCYFEDKTGTTLTSTSFN